MLDLQNGYALHKIDPYFPGDVSLMERWNQDSLLTENVWKLDHEIFQDLRYLNYKELYASPFSIWYQNEPIGFLDISPILLQTYCYLAYGLLKEFRGKGHASYVIKKVLLEIFKDQVNCIERVQAIVNIDNLKSQHCLESVGFYQQSSNISRYGTGNYVYAITPNKVK